MAAPISLERGKVISAVDGVVDTWEWFIKKIKGIKGVDGISVEQTDNGIEIGLDDEDEEEDDDEYGDIPETPDLPVLDMTGLMPSRPWSFECTEDETTHVRTGGWYNQVVQLAMSILSYDTPADGFTDNTSCADGDYYLKVDISLNSALNKSSCEIVIGNTPTDGYVFFYIGTVANGKQTSGHHVSPVVYTYL